MSVAASFVQRYLSVTKIILRMKHIILTFFIVAFIVDNRSTTVAQSRKVEIECASIIPVKTNAVQSRQTNLENVAVILGVANYWHDSSLDNTINDAKGMAEYFHSIGYKVVLRLDPTKKQVNKSIDSILRVMDPDATFVFFAAGHGSEYKGENFLALVDSWPLSKEDLPRETFSIQKLFRKIQNAKIRTTISFLDICRTPPRIEKFRESNINRFQYDGYQTVKSPAGFFTGFSTSSGKSAKDAEIDTRNHSPFTFAMLEYIRIPYLSLEQFYDSVIIRTRYLTRNVQTPIKESNLEGNFYFNLRYKPGNDSTVITRITNQSDFITWPLPDSRGRIVHDSVAIK